MQCPPHRIETILSCRLVLNLRRVAHQQQGQLSAGQSTFQLQFASNGFLGNIGAPLRSIDDEWNLDEERERDNDAVVTDQLQVKE